jgi:hypothetical protein
MVTVHSLTEHDEHFRNDGRWAVVERIAQSQHMKTSQRLCQFLYYVSECAIRGVAEEATEQQIGIRVFGRSPGYNSSEDSIVRTHARLLRQKLESYYAKEGAEEEIVVEIPKGHYLPTFRARDENDSPVVKTAWTTRAVKRSKRIRMTILPTRAWTLGIGLAVVVILASSALFLWHKWHKPTAAESPVEAFWSPFLTGESPIVIYSNAVFTGNSTSGLKYAPQEDTSKPEGTNYVDTYTGIGELASVYNITRLFDAHHTNFILKRSLLVTWDEAESRNLVFIGSPAENTSLRVLPALRDFSMVATPDSSGVVNHNPAAGEQALYSRPEHPLTTDYAILALVPGMHPDKRMLIFSGLTTFGTQGAVDYVCHPETAAELLKKITGPKGDIRPFEAVLETTIQGGVPIQTRLVTIHVH